MEDQHEQAFCNRTRNRLESLCPDLELLAAYLENRLANESRENLERHFLECRLCRRTIAQSIKSESVVPYPAPVRKAGR